MTLTFGPSTSEREVRVGINDDPALEFTESFLATLSAPLGEKRVSFVENQATVSILDNDGELCMHGVVIL